MGSHFEFIAKLGKDEFIPLAYISSAKKLGKKHISFNLKTYKLIDDSREIVNIIESSDYDGKTKQFLINGILDRRADVSSSGSGSRSGASKSGASSGVSRSGASSSRSGVSSDSTASSSEQNKLETEARTREVRSDTNPVSELFNNIPNRNNPKRSRARSRRREIPQYSFG